MSKTKHRKIKKIKKIKKVKTIKKVKKVKKMTATRARKKRRSSVTVSSAKRRQKPVTKGKRSSKPVLKVKRRRKSVSFTVAQLAKGTVLVKSNKYLSLSQAKIKRDFLLRLRESITGQINFLSTDNLIRSDKDNEVSYRSEEQGTDNFDRDFALNRVSLDQDILFEIDEALNRLAMGTYGVCENCERGIEKRRLKAVPYSRMCIACKSKNEGGRKNFKTFETSSYFPAADKAPAEEE